MLYEDKNGNLLEEEYVRGLSPLQRKELGLHPSSVDSGEFFD